MYSNFQLAKKYLHYYISAHNGKGHGMHSPFVFDMILHVLNNQRHIKTPPAIEQLRRQLLKDSTQIEVTDFGAGSRKDKSNHRKVTDIAKAALKPEKFGQLFYRLVKHYQPQTILELGTSFGITTAYMAMAHPAATVITVEGSDAIAGIAQRNFKQLGISNIEQIIAPFDDILPSLLNKHTSIDLAYVDGNHRYDPTIHYFSELLKHTTTDSILIFDDIHWSMEMEKAWHYIQQHEAVRTTVDLFFIGIVLLRPEFKEKQHFQIRF